VGGNAAAGVDLETNAPLAVTNDISQTFAENAAQRDAAYWQFALGVLAIAVRQFEDQ
jgi:hypothetical protein